MAYTTLAALKKAIPERTLAQLSNDVPPAITVDADVIDEGIRHATELIDAALRNRYTLPLTDVPSLVSSIAVDLFRHWLYTRRPEGREDLPPSVVRGYKTAMDLLKQIREGSLSLGVVGVPNAGQPAATRIRSRHSGDREFSADRLKGLL